MQTKKSFRDKRIETFELITVAVCCGYVSDLIGRRTINIPEIIFGVHASSVSTVILNFPAKLQAELFDVTHTLLAPRWGRSVVELWATLEKDFVGI